MRLDRHIQPESSVMLLDRHPYLHGGGFGIATEILADLSLADVFETLEPRRFIQCDRILNRHKRVLNATCAKEITLSMENSPVIAALAQIKLGVTSLEWDLWLDPKKPQSLKRAVVEHGSVFATLLGQFSFMRSYFLKSAPSVTEWLRIYKEAIFRFNALSNRKIEKMPSVCLDIKSIWSTADDINRFIRALKETFQINVCYVGSFSYQQIAQVTESKTILFCHAVWDLQQKVESGCFSKTLMLNGADLEERSHLEILREIVNKHELEIGIYVQEPEAGTEAVQRLIQMVNSEPKLFKLGFALGNSRDGRSSKMIKGSGAGVQKILLTNGILSKMQRMISQISLFVRSFFSFNYWSASRRYRPL
ncbi:MAG: hypothetical protein Q8L98_02015 [Chlamydiales bacterium]|nr:hypothetical protein [Chlamydiales bacterium]